MRGSRGKFGGPEPSPLLRWKIPVYSIYIYSKISENMSRRSSPRQLKYPSPPPPTSPGKMDPHMTLFDLCSSFFENLNPIFNMNINWHINACVLDENITAMEVTLDWLNFN